MKELTSEEIDRLGSVKEMQRVLLHNSGKIAKLRASIARLTAAQERERALREWIEAEIVACDAPDEYLHGKRVGLKQVRRKMDALAAPPAADVSKLSAAESPRDVDNETAFGRVRIVGAGVFDVEE